MGDLFLALASSPQAAIQADRVERVLRSNSEPALLTRYSDSNLALLSIRSTRYDESLWQPYQTREGVTIAIAGRIAFKPEQWGEVADRRAAAAKTLARAYAAQGQRGLCTLNGNFTAVIYDRPKGEVHVVGDCAGVSLMYRTTPASDGFTLCSHPDLLAASLNTEPALDETSLREFVATGSVSFPFTYYKGIQALPWAHLHTFVLREGRWALQDAINHFDDRSAFDHSISEDDTIERLSATIQEAIKIRSLPILGKTAVAMSGGMDSRAILSNLQTPGDAVGFTLIDTPNDESSTAAQITKLNRASFTLIQRSPNHYSTSAPGGARIGGGMSSLASNHFLGARDRIVEMGVSNLLTGCYCDYLFKGLALNLRETPILRRDAIVTPSLQFYRPHLKGVTTNDFDAYSRKDEAFRVFNKQRLSDEELFALEKQRCFPFAREGDSAQRIITQRALPWYAVMADRGILDAYRSIPPRLKLNNELFTKILVRICPKEILQVRNSNTGAPLGAGVLTQAFYRYFSAAQRRLYRTLNTRKANIGSWPNWDICIQNDPSLRSQWEDRSEPVRDLLQAIVSRAVWERDISEFQGSQVETFHRVWTLILWRRHRFQPSEA